MADELAFGAWLKQRRKELGVTQKELARAAMCSITTIEKIEAGIRKPSRQVASLLAASLEIPDGERSLFVQFARSELPGPARVQVGNRAPWLTLSEEHISLPAPVTTFVGREGEVAAARDLLALPTTRLLTLTGPPGIGKTRLALQVASRFSFSDGVRFVPLAPVRDPALMGSAIASVLGVRESGNAPLVENVKRYLSDKEILLVLDNLEQLIPAVPLLAQMLEIAPRLKLLATSREILRVYGEHNFPVPPLALPDLSALPSTEDLAQQEAIRLFVERSTAVSPDFRLTEENAPAVAKICVQLDGLPLAIELAAARTLTLSPHEILERLSSRMSLLNEGPRDFSARQQTLRGAIDWSYELLDEVERTAFRQFSVFVGGCTSDAASVILDFGFWILDEHQNQNPKSKIQNMTESLAGKSLLQQGEINGEQRFWMLETVREYASERLDASGETEETHRRHAIYYLALAERAQAGLTGPEQATWWSRLETEHGNMRASLLYALDKDDAETALRLGVSLWKFWLSRGYLSEGRNWLSLALQEGAGASEAIRAAALNGAGNLAFTAGDLPGARLLYEGSLALRRQLDDKQGMAQVMNNLALLLLTETNLKPARSLLKESLAIKREIGDRPGIAASLANLGLISRDMGEYREARALMEESLAIRREVGHKQSIALSVNGLGSVILALGDQALAKVLMEECLALNREIGDQQGIGLALIDLAEVARAEGNYRAAIALGQEGLAIFDQLGDMLDAAIALHNLGQILLRQGQVQRAEELFAQSLKIREELDNKRGIIECLAAIACVAVARGDFQKSVRLIASVETLCDKTGFRLYPLDHAEYDRNKTIARSKLGESAWTHLMEDGSSMNIRDSIAYALGNTISGRTTYA